MSSVTLSAAFPELKVNRQFWKLQEHCPSARKEAAFFWTDSTSRKSERPPVKHNEVKLRSACSKHDDGFGAKSLFSVTSCVGVGLLRSSAKTVYK